MNEYVIVPTSDKKILVAPNRYSVAITDCGTLIKGSDYIRQFSKVDMVGDALVVNHSLGKDPSFVVVTDDNGMAVSITNYENQTPNRGVLYLTGFDVQNVWTVRIM